MTPKENKSKPLTEKQKKKEKDPGKRTTRREFIKKGLIAAVYVTPVIESAFMSDVEADEDWCNPHGARIPGMCKPNCCKPGLCNPQSCPPHPVSPCRPFTCPPARCKPYLCTPQTG